MAAHVIVLANRTAAAPELIEALVHRGERGPIHATLVMPAGGPGRGGRGRRRRSGWTRRWRPGVQPGIEHCEGVVCDPVPLEALTEVWDPMRHDEVIVSHAAGPVARSGSAATSRTPSRATRASRCCTSSRTTRRSTRRRRPPRCTSARRSARSACCLGRRPAA